MRRTIHRSPSLTFLALGTAIPALLVAAMAALQDPVPVDLDVLVEARASGASSSDDLAPLHGRRSETPGGASLELPFSYAVGTTYRWALDHRERVVVSASDEDGGESQRAEDPAPAAYDSRFEIAGRLRARVYAALGADRAIGLVIEEARWIPPHGDGHGDAEPAAAPAFAEEVLVRLSPRGEVLATAFPAGAGDDLRMAWRSVLARWQVVGPEDSGAEGWVVEEEDTTGRYEASYRRGTSHGGTLQKRKQAYRSLGEGSPGAEEWQIDLDAEAIVDLRGAAPGIVWQERVSMDLPGLGRTIHLQATARTEPIGVVPETWPSEVVEEKVRRLLAHGAPGLAADSPEDTSDLLATVDGSLADLLRGLREPGGADRAARIGPLVEALLADPLGAEAVLRALRQSAAEDAVVAALTGALASAGTPEAQQALAAFASDDAMPGGARVTALLAMAHVERPEPPLLEALEGLAYDTGSLGPQALLVLGIAGDRVRVTDSSRHQRVLEGLVAAAEGAREDRRRLRAAAEAIANLAPEHAPSRVLAWLSDPEAAVRRAGIRALRHVPDAAIDEAYLALLRSDPTPAVRRAVLEAAADAGRPTLCQLHAAVGEADRRDPTWASLLHRLDALVREACSGMEGPPAATASAD